MVIYNFEFEELPEDDLATFYFKGQFFLGGNSRYRMMTDADTICETHINRKALIQMPTLLLGGYLSAIAANNSQTDDTSHYTAVQAMQKVETDKNFPIYNCGGKFRRGIYLTYEDFLQHRPQEVEFIQQDHYIENKVNKPMFYYTNEKGKKGDRIDSVFAIYNGQNWYQPNESGWGKLRYEHGDFYRRQLFLGLRNNSANQFTGSGMFAFGIVGGIVAGIADAAIRDARKDKRDRGVYEARLNPVRRAYYPVKRIF